MKNYLNNLNLCVFSFLSMFSELLQVRPRRIRSKLAKAEVLDPKHRQPLKKSEFGSCRGAETYPGREALLEKVFLSFILLGIILS